MAVSERIERYKKNCSHIAKRKVTYNERKKYESSNRA